MIRCLYLSRSVDLSWDLFNVYSNILGVLFVFNEVLPVIYTLNLATITNENKQVNRLKKALNLTLSLGKTDTVIKNYM
ncbi:hypothetical protein A3Q34_18440 [Colwellia sp. PAMC 20917]|nr:hypothetical protein A3Q34_18440 [Colwellia sp. PAMC 20917]